MTQPGWCTDMQSTELIEQAMEDVFRSATRTQPELMVLDPVSHRAFQLISDEQQRLKDVCTPRGLSQMFPGLKSTR